MSASYRVRALLHPLLESTQVFFLYTALLELAGAEEIELSWDAVSRAADYAITMELERLADGARRRVCFDIHDRSYLFFEPELKACDVYFKRSHHAPDVAKLAPELRAKVVAFGPIFGPGNRSAVRPLVAGWLRYAFANPKKAGASFRHLTDFLRLPVTRDFERGPEHEMPPRVLLQTRLWMESEVTAPPFAPEINEERVGVVRALRKALGERFVGGALATPFAVREYPDLVREQRRRDGRIGHRRYCDLHAGGLRDRSPQVPRSDVPVAPDGRADGDPAGGPHPAALPRAPAARPDEHLPGRRPGVRRHARPDLGLHAGELLSDVAARALRGCPDRRCLNHADPSQHRPAALGSWLCHTGRGQRPVGLE